MKATGIVRRIDDLGRVVVPKEIRRNLQIRDGDPLEIYTDDEEMIVLKKYSQLGKIRRMAEQFTDIVGKSRKHAILLITDREEIIAANGDGKKLLNRKLTGRYLEILEMRNIQCGNNGNISIADETPGDDKIICPVMCEGDVVGSVVMMWDNGIIEKQKFDESDVKLVQLVANFLGKQMEL